MAVNSRSKQQNAARVRFWRNRSKFQVRIIDGKEKFFKDKEVVKKCDLQSLVTDEFYQCKGAGSRKLKHWLMTRYRGVSER